MPSYNQAGYIREAVASVLAQDDPNWELWILDNSTDETPDFLRSLSDPRIHAEHRPRRMDPGTCLNEMLAKAAGDYFAFIHTDNRLLPGFVRRHREVLGRDPLALAYSDFHEINGTGRRQRTHRRPDPFPAERLFSCDSLGVPFAATTALAQQVGGFPAGDLADDVFFAIAADAVGPRFHIPEPLVEYRAHSQSRTELSGMWAVRRAIHRTVVAAYKLRDARLADPFAGRWGQVEAHVARASGMARILARHLLARAGWPDQPWIDGTDPASFWLAWACFETGHPPAGFVDRRPGQLLGLPVADAAPGPVLRPRRCGFAPEATGPGLLLPLQWLLGGCSAEGRALRRLTPEAMAIALVPFQVAHSEKISVWIRGQGAVAAYVAYGAAQLGDLDVAGFVAVKSAFGSLPCLPDAVPGTPPWVLPGEAGPGLVWAPRGRAMIED